MTPTICLVIPPSIFLLDERVFMNLGILKVAAVLERNGYPVQVVDLSGISNYEEAIADHARQSIASIYGITATTPQIPAATKIVRAVRRGNPAAKVLLGGPHATLVNAAYKREVKNKIDGRATKAMQQMQELYDTVIAGDGELAIIEYLKNVNVKFIDADDPKGPFFMSNQVLENTPYPARHLIDFDSYKYTIDGVRATSLIAQLGCPFSCGFCGGRESSMLRRIRTRSSASIIRELEFLHTAHGINGFMFYDDELNVNKAVVELMKSITALAKKHKTEFKLRGFVKSELFTEQQAEAMYEAGFRWLLVGFESGSPRILENINKKASREDNDRCMEIARKYGLKVKALMSVGHPGESEETIAETKNWLLTQKPNDFDLTIITTYPGTSYYDLAEETSPGIWTYTCPKSKDRLHAYSIDYTEVADYYKGDPNGGYKAYVYTDHLSSEQLVSIRDVTEKEVRSILNIPFYQAQPAVRYEHSMGQFGSLPPNILKVSSAVPAERCA